MTKATPQRSARILTEWIKEIQRRSKKEGEKKKGIPAIEDELAYAIGLSGHTIESWRGGKRHPENSQVVSVAKEIVRRLQTVEQQEFLDFLSGFGHPYPLMVWQELHSSSKVDIPAPEEHFIAREEKIAELISAVEPGRIVSLCGPGGVGKTSLVIAAIQRLASGQNLARQFPHGILYYNFYGGYTIDDACRYIAKFFGVAIPDNRQPREVAREELYRRQALLVLDGAEEVADLGELLRIRNNNSVLIVTRYRSTARGTLLDLEPPPLEIAISILQTWSTDTQNQSGFQAWRNDQSADHKVIEEICELLGRLPLALRLAGRYMLHCTTKAYQFLELLKEWGLSLLHEGEHQHDLSVMILMEKSLEQISKAKGAEDAWKVLACIGLLSYTPFDLALVTDGLEMSPSSIFKSIGVLNKFSMLKWIIDERYQVVHRLIHTYAQKHLTLTISSEVLIRLAGYYIKLATDHPQFGGKDNAKLDVERPHIMAILANCVDQKEWTSVIQLVRAIGEQLHLRGYLVDSKIAYESGLKAAQTLKDRQSEGIWLGNLGMIYADLGQPETAINYYQQALIIAQEIGNRDGEGNILGSLGKTYYIQGQRETAIDYYQQALIISREIGNRSGEANQLSSLGIAYANLGQREKAITHYEQALSISRENGDRRSEGIYLGYMGMAYSALGHYQIAIDYHQQALSISRENGDRRSEGNHLGNLGNVYADLGQPETAINYYQQALAIAREIGNRRGEANQLGNLGTVYIDLGQVETAIDYQRQALSISRESGDQEAEGIWLGAIGNGYRSLKQMETASDYHQQALAIAREIGDRDSESTLLGNLGMIYADLGQPETAINYYQQALIIAQEIGNRRGEANQLDNLGTIYVNLGQPETAINYYQQALIIAQEIGNRRGEGISLANLGEVYANLKKVQIAQRYWEQAMHIFVEIKSPHAELVRGWLKNLEDK